MKKITSDLKIGAISQVYNNLTITFSDIEKCNTAAYIVYIIGLYSYSYYQPVFLLRLM